MPTKTIIYTFKPWVGTYAFWIGVVQLVGFNLAGFFWLAWSHGMDHRPDYQPFWMYWIHWLHVALAAVMLVLLAIGIVPSRIHVFSEAYEVHPLISTFVVTLIGAIYAMPLFGITRTKMMSRQDPNQETATAEP